MQALEVNVLADAAPESEGQKPQQQQEEDTKPNLQADLPAKVDEPGISIPSAQLTLAVPSESTEERSEKPAGQDDQTDGQTDRDAEQTG